MEAFKAAAEAVKEQSMPVEDRVAKWIRRWMKVRRRRLRCLPRRRREGWNDAGCCTQRCSARCVGACGSAAGCPQEPCQG